MTTTVEPGPDGAVIVRGLTLEAVAQRLIPRSPGRPAGPELTRAEIRAAVDSRREWSDDPTQDELAADLGVSRTRLREAIGRNYGSWRQFRAITATAPARDSAP